jgi:ribose transport system substrate-binding protein
VAAAQAAVSSRLAAPTSLAVTQPLKARPPAGKTIVSLQCDAGSQCLVVNDSVKAATAAVGWNFRSIPFQLANPATLIAAMQQALQVPNVVGVVFFGLPEAVWASEVPAYQNANVALIPGSAGPLTPSPVVPAGMEGPGDTTAHGVDIGNYFIADSGGTGTVLDVNVPAIPSTASMSSSFTNTVAGHCGQCKVQELDVTLAQVGANQVVSAVEAALQRNPSINYVLSVQGGFTDGLPAALRSIGESKVKIIGTYPTIATEQDIVNGSVQAFTLTSYSILGWNAVDIALRFSEGMAMTPGVGEGPRQILTKSNLGTPATSIDRPANYQDLFKALWHVS